MGVCKALGTFVPREAEDSTRSEEEMGKSAVLRECLDMLARPRKGSLEAMEAF